MSIQGRPRLHIAETGVHLILWGTLSRIRKKANSPVQAAWAALSPADRKAWLLAISMLCFSDNSRTVGNSFARAYALAPDATLAVLPAMRAAALATTEEVYRAACYGWHDPDGKTMKQFTQTERDVRRRMRKALAEFVAETAQQPT